MIKPLQCTRALLGATLLLLFMTPNRPADADFNGSGEWDERANRLLTHLYQAACANFDVNPAENKKACEAKAKKSLQELQKDGKKIPCEAGKFQAAWLGMIERTCLFTKPTDPHWARARLECFANAQKALPNGSLLNLRLLAFALQNKIPANDREASALIDGVQASLDIERAWIEKKLEEAKKSEGNELRDFKSYELSRLLKCTNSELALAQPYSGWAPEAWNHKATYKELMQFERDSGVTPVDLDPAHETPARAPSAK